MLSPALSEGAPFLSPGAGGPCKPAAATCLHAHPRLAEGCHPTPPHPPLVAAAAGCHSTTGPLYPASAALKVRWRKQGGSQGASLMQQGGKLWLQACMAPGTEDPA